MMKPMTAGRQGSTRTGGSTSKSLTTRIVSSNSSPTPRNNPHASPAPAGEFFSRPAIPRPPTAAGGSAGPARLHGLRQQGGADAFVCQPAQTPDEIPAGVRTSVEDLDQMSTDHDRAAKTKPQGPVQLTPQIGRAHV